MFSFRLGVAGRVGDRRLGEVIRVGEPLFVGEVLRCVEPEPWLICGRVCLVGVTTSEDDPAVVGLSSCSGDTADVSVDAVPGLRSDRELLLFLRTFTTPLVGISRIEDKDAVSSWELPGLRRYSCDVDAPGRSREPGRRRWPKLVSISIDFERSKEPLGVPGSESPVPLLLLRVLNIDETLLSPSDR